MFWLWFAVWVLLILFAAGLFALLGLSLFRKAKALTRELGRAADRLGALSAELDQLADRQPAPDLAVFEDPTRLRQDRVRTRAKRRKASGRRLSGQTH